MLDGVKKEGTGFAECHVGTSRRGSYQQHFLTPPLSQALAARFSPQGPDVNKPRGSHIKVVGHRSRGRIHVSGYEASIDRPAASECIAMADRPVKKNVIQATSPVTSPSPSPSPPSSSIIMIGRAKAYQSRHAKSLDTNRRHQPSKRNM